MSRLPQEVRKEQLLNAALRVAQTPGGWAKMTRAAVAKEAELSEAMVSIHFGTMIDFRRTVMRAAIRAGNLKIIAQGLAVGDMHAKKAPQVMKDAAALSLVG